ncbi:hypothetical protein OHL96_002755 [Enterococcus faecium]|nr:hypothetical protein [Enterococcus faecium]
MQVCEKNPYLSEIPIKLVDGLFETPQLGQSTGISKFFSEIIVYELLENL